MLNAHPSIALACQIDGGRRSQGLVPEAQRTKSRGPKGPQLEYTVSLSAV